MPFLVNVSIHSLDEMCRSIFFFFFEENFDLMPQLEASGKKSPKNGVQYLHTKRIKTQPPALQILVPFRE